MGSASVALSQTWLICVHGSIGTCASDASRCRFDYHVYCDVGLSPVKCRGFLPAFGPRPLCHWWWVDAAVFHSADAWT